MLPFLIAAAAATSQPFSEALKLPLSRFSGSGWGTPENARGLISGVASAEVLIDPAGKPVSCKRKFPQEETGISAWLCLKLLHSTRYRPATDTSGNPVWGVIVRWYRVAPNGIENFPEKQDVSVPINRLPKGARPTMLLRYIVSVDGRVLACQAAESSGNNELDDLACGATDGEPFPPATALGAPAVTTVRTRTVGFAVSAP